MENRFEHNKPEEQGWGAYATPPQYLGKDAKDPLQTNPTTPPGVERNMPFQAGLCARVLEYLPSLLENDGEVRPDQAAHIYAHLAACPDCARQFDEMQRVVAMVEALVPMEPPIDFSGIIMQRIQTEFGSARSPVVPYPTVAVSSQSTGEAADLKPVMDLKQTIVSAHVAEQRKTVEPVQVQATRTETVQTRTTRTETVQTTASQQTMGVWERLTMGGVLAAVLAFFLSTGWGRNMLNVNLQTAGAWLAEIRVVLDRIPVLSAMVGALLFVLARANDELSETYRTLGGKAAVGFALDVAIAATAYYFFIARKRRGQSPGY